MNLPHTYHRPLDPAPSTPEYLAERVQGARHGSQGDQPLPIPDARKLAETKRLTMGFHEVFGALYDRLGFQKVFGARKKMAARLFRQAVLMRLAAPGSSKRACCDKLSRHHGVEVNPDKFYRMMDAVNDDRIARLQSIVSHEVRGLLQEHVDVLFFDVTTLFFASDKADDLRKKGFSKDGKPQKVQVVLALFQSVEGLPIGYELFPGSTTDVRTLQPALKALRERFEIGRVVLVADAGMLSQGNLDLLASQGWDWVVAARLRSLPRRMEAELFESHDWVAVSEDISVTELQLKGQRLVLRHSKKRADKDVHERDSIVEKLKRSLRQGIKGSGKRGRFLKVDRNAVDLDQDAIDRDACFDGLHGVWTSLDRESHPAQHIYAYYGELWRIEEGFRVLKHTMATRPIYHWTPQPRQGPHRDLLRRFCLAALPAQHHACGPRATQRGPYPDRAERRSSLPHYRHQYAEAVSARLPRHRSSADALQRSRTKVPQQDPRAGHPRPAPLRSPATIERSLKGSLKIGTRSVHYCMLIKYHSYYFAPKPRKSRFMI